MTPREALELLATDAVNDDLIQILRNALDELEEYKRLDDMGRVTRHNAPWLWKPEGGEK